MKEIERKRNARCTFLTANMLRKDEESNTNHRNAHVLDLYQCHAMPSEFKTLGDRHLHASTPCTCREFLKVNPPLKPSIKVDKGIAVSLSSNTEKKMQKKRGKLCSAHTVMPKAELAGCPSLSELRSNSTHLHFTSAIVTDARGKHGTEMTVGIRNAGSRQSECVYKLRRDYSDGSCEGKIKCLGLIRPWVLR